MSYSYSITSIDRQHRLTCTADLESRESTAVVQTSYIAYAHVHMYCVIACMCMQA